jgi:hypothetical protein
VPTFTVFSLEWSAAADSSPIIVPDWTRFKRTFNDWATPLQHTNLYGRHFFGCWFEILRCTRIASGIEV